MTDSGPDISPDSSWWRDHWLWVALGVALVLRVLPLILWPMGECVRDECIYRSIAYKIIEGDGLSPASKGWLPAPGYPYLLAAMKVTFGSYQSVKVVQIVLSMISVVFMYLIGRRLQDRKVARISAWLFAVHPTLAWFTNTLWIETIYIFFLLGAMGLVLWSRDRSWASAILPGMMLGGAVLFKGVATYLPPFFLLALCYPTQASSKGVREGLARGWQHAIGFVVGLLLVVAPYSVHATQKHGAFIVTDATSGHVLYLGNNDYPPLTFDYGNGMLTQPLFQRYLRQGRRPCPRKDKNGKALSAVKTMECESDRAVEWIKDNPKAFVSRVPMRLAQMFNPHTFLTRHVRWGYFPGLPWGLKEALVLWVALTTVVISFGGTVGAWARARGPFGAMALGTVIYTLGTSALLYGMTRFRLPLEPLWIFYVAMVFADFKGTRDIFSQSTWRSVGLLLTLPPLIALTGWYALTGWPLFW